MPEAEQAAQRFEKNWNPWRSVEIETHTERSFHPDLKRTTADPIRSLETHYVETVLGHRLFDETLKKQNGVLLHHAGYCDGTRNASLAFHEGVPSSQEQMIVSDSFMTENRTGWSQRPVPLMYHSVGKVPLQDALRRPGVEYVGVDRVLERQCDVFHFKKVPWKKDDKEVVFHLDHATSTPLAVDVYDNDDRYRAGEPLSTWRASAVSEINGRLIVMSSEGKTYRDEVASRAEPASVTHHTVRQIRFDRDYPASTFWPGLQDGTHVFDAMTRKQYDVGGQKKEPQTSASVSSQPSRSIRVEPVASPFQFYAVVTTGLGACVLLMALILWFRRR